MQEVKKESGVDLSKGTLKQKYVKKGNRMYDKLSATMLGSHHANKLYDAANVNEVKNTLRAAVMEQKKTTTGAQLDVLILSYEDGVYRQLDTIQVR